LEPVALSLVALPVVLALGWWLFVQTEGVYLGARVVRWLYDRSALEYDEIKEFDDEADDRHLGQPLSERLAGDEQACVLDVGTGTARLPLTLFRHLDFKGRVVGLDSSRAMLDVAVAKTVFFSESVDLVENDAKVLPFRPAAFDAVACIEVLEFLPSVAGALCEMVRVLKPGGTLVVSNRRGLDRWTFPGRAFAAADFEKQLRSLGLPHVATYRWLSYYELIWAEKEQAG